MPALGRSREVTNGSFVAAKLTEDPCAQRRLRGSPDAGSGSGCDRHLTRFVAGKPPLEVRFPQAAARRRVLSTPSGRCDFRKAAGQVPRDSTSFAAPKLPFVTSRTRPSAAPRSFYNAAIQMTSELRNLSLSAFNPLGQHCSWSRDALGQGVVWVTPG